MKRRISLSAASDVKRLAFLLALLLSSVTGAGERILIPEEMDLPYYALGLGHTDEGWVGWTFYRPLESIPKKAVLHPATLVYGIDPAESALLVEGFVIMDECSSTPILQKLQNRPGEFVEIGFVYKDDFFAALGDGQVTAKEARAMPSLVVGWAAFYEETFQPFDPNDPKGPRTRNVVAAGLLEDGRPFFLHATHTPGLYSVDLVVGH